MQSDDVPAHTYPVVKDEIKTSPETRRAVVGGVIGHVVEWYDYSVYGYLAVVIGTVFFPSSSAYGSLMASFAVFGVGFFTRPLGGLVFGHYGDKLGRRQMLILTVAIMSGATFLIGVLPGYGTAGALGPILLVLLRLLQGFSAGGEWGGATAFLVEHAPPRKRGMFGSLQQVGIGSGLFLGSAMVALVTSTLDPAVMESWGWRIPFLVAPIIGLIAVYIRLKVAETPDFKQVVDRKLVEHRPIVEAWHSHKRAMLMVVGFDVTATVAYYVFLVYFPSYARAVLDFPASVAAVTSNIGLVAFVLSALFFGYLSDKVGRKPILIAHSVLLVVFAYPMLRWLNENPVFPVLLAAQLFGAIVMGLFSGPGMAAFAELFPTRIRYSGLSVPYNLATALFGGTAGFVVTALIAATGDPLVIAYYVMAAAAISLVFYLVMTDHYKEPLEE